MSTEANLHAALQPSVMLESPQSRESASFRSSSSSSPHSADSLLPSERLALSISIPSSTTTETISTPIKKSRNDLFTLDWSSSMTPNLNTFTPPPPRLTSPAVAARPSWTELQQRQPDIQIVLPLTPPCGTLPLLPMNALQGQLPATPTSPVSFSVSARPLSLRISTEDDKEEAEVATGQSTNPVLDSRQSPRLRLQPTPDFLLGEGRHASVFLASFIPTTKSAPAPDSSSHLSPASKWTLCAAKRVLPDRESQLAGLGEAFILSKLASTGPAMTSLDTFPSLSAGASHILRLHGVKDERDGVESTGPNYDSPSRRQSGNFLPQIRSCDGTAFHSRSRSDAQVGSQSRMSDISPPILRHSSLHSQPCTHSASQEVEDEIVQEGTGVKVLILKEIRRKERGPRYSEPFSSKKAFLGVGNVLTKLKPKVSGNAGVEIPIASITSRRASGEHTAFLSTTQVTPPLDTGPSAPPRIVLILEYCPFGHILSFMKSYPERMGRKRWLEWARQLVSAVVWMHSKGVLHADLKPQNVLVGMILILL